MFKKKKMRLWLEKQDKMTVFSFVVRDYVDGTLKRKLTELGMSHLSIHVDWVGDHVSDET